MLSLYWYKGSKKWLEKRRKAKLFVKKIEVNEKHPTSKNCNKQTNDLKNYLLLLKLYFGIEINAIVHSEPHLKFLQPSCNLLQKGLSFSRENPKYECIGTAPKPDRSV